MPQIYTIVMTLLSAVGPSSHPVTQWMQWTQGSHEWYRYWSITPNNIRLMTNMTNIGYKVTKSRVTCDLDGPNTMDPKSFVLFYYVTRTLKINITLTIKIYFYKKSSLLRSILYVRYLVFMGLLVIFGIMIFFFEIIFIKLHWLKHLFFLLKKKNKIQKKKDVPRCSNW